MQPTDTPFRPFAPRFETQFPKTRLLAVGSLLYKKHTACRAKQEQSVTPAFSALP